METETAIITENIKKTYDKVTALDRITIRVNKGEIFGLIGADGAGKTSLIRILTSLIIPDSGKAQVMGYDTVKDYKQIRKIIGYMPGKFALYQDLTVLENMELFASIFKTTIAENYDLVKPIYSQIEPFKNRLAGQLSGGMKQKLALSAALIHKPEVLFLDEPTTGVDPVSRKEFWDMLANLKNYGITIFVSTPYMDEARKCDRIALIQSGKILSVETPVEIENGFSHKLFSIKSEQMYKLLKILKEYEYSNSVHTFGDKVHYTDKRIDFETDELNNYLMKKGLNNFVISSINPTIEDCFMEMMVKK